MTAELQHMRIERKGDVAVIILANVELFDRLVIDEVRQELTRFIDAERPQKVVLNLENVTRCSTEVINGFLLARKRLAAYGAQFKLCAVRDELRNVLRILRLDGTVLEIRGSQDEALESFT